MKEYLMVPNLPPISSSSEKHGVPFSLLFLIILLPAFIIILHYYLKAQNEVYSLRHEFEKKIKILKKELEENIESFQVENQSLKMNLSKVYEERKNLENTIQELLESKSKSKNSGQDSHRSGYIPQKSFEDTGKSFPHIQTTLTFSYNSLPDYIQYNKYPKWEQFRFKGILASSRANDITSDEVCLWISTDKGVLCYNKLKKQWRIYGKEDGLYGFQTSKIISTRDYVFVSCSGPSDTAGIYRLDKNKGKWERFRLYCAYGFWLEGEELWISRIFEKGIEVYNLRTGAQYIYTTSNGLLHNAVGGISSDQFYIWISHMGTYNLKSKSFSGGGVSRLDKRTKTWRYLTVQDGLADSYVRTVCTCGDDVWFGHEIGVSRYNINTGQFSVYPRPSGTYCINVSRDSIWFGNLKGLIRQWKTTHKIEEFGEKDGLPGSMINGITIDNENVWIAASSNGEVRPYGGFARYIASEHN